MSSRIGAIDFWRGLVLIAILVDHVPGNGLEYATPRNYGFSDSAEAFVFLSGLSVGAVYLPRARRLGAFAVGRACLKRALKLYGVHLSITAAALAIFFSAFSLTGIYDLILPHGRWALFDDPGRAASGIAVLSHQLGYFNILPLYIALMVWAPLVVALSLSRPRMALAASLGIYAAARYFDLNLPNWPDEGRWFFNPFAWQLMFTCGVAAAARGLETPRGGAGAVSACLAVALGAAFVVTDGFGFSEGLRAEVWSRFDLGKQNLGLARILHFFALAYLAAAFSQSIEGRFGRFAELLRVIGRHSLPVFAVGSILAALGQTAMTIGAAWGSSEATQAFGAAYTLTAVVVSHALARRLDSGAPLWRPGGVGRDPVAVPAA